MTDDARVSLSEAAPTAAGAADLSTGTAATSDGAPRAAREPIRTSADERHQVGTPEDRTRRAGFYRPAPALARAALRTSRALDFCSRKELTAQTGHPPEHWPLVLLKELLDNACEEAGVAPVVTVRVDHAGVRVADNGPGLPAEVVAGVLDFAVRVSSREAYVAPDRGAQGNALKTVVAMPFVLDGRRGQVEIAARGIRHRIAFALDPIRQEPVVAHEREPALVTAGTEIAVAWPDSASPLLLAAEGRFLQMAEDYTFLNPHLTLEVDWFGRRMAVEATEPGWGKWRPSMPTCPLWYTPRHLERLIAGYIAHDRDHGRERTVREFVAEFRGLSGSAKQKRVLDATGLHRAPLSRLATADGLDREAVGRLLAAIQALTRPVSPQVLGVIGQAHLRRRFEGAGCEMDSFEYRRVLDTTDGVPWALEAAFGW